LITQEDSKREKKRRVEEGRRARPSFHREEDRGLKRGPVSNRESTDERKVSR
jgi:hypothetical protein